MSKNLLKKFFSVNKTIYKPKPMTYEKIEEYEILQYGYPESRYLRMMVSNLLPINSIKNLKTHFDSLKLTAANNNLYSLSFPQVKKDICAFCMYKDLRDYKWINTNENIKLNVNNYDIIINPRIISMSKVCHFEYEECGSFKM